MGFDNDLLVCYICINPNPVLMDYIKHAGGARIGMGRVSWPFARLTVNPSRLEIHASILGSFVFAPDDVISINKSSGFLGRGIQICHKVNNYKKRIEFVTSLDPDEIINQIKEVGFLDNSGLNISEDIKQKQMQGAFSVRLLAVVSIFLTWNSLFLYDIYNYIVRGDKVIPLGKGAIAGTGFIFIITLLTNFHPDFRKIILKKGRDIDELRPFIYFLMLISGTMFTLLNIIYNFFLI